MDARQQPVQRTRFEFSQIGIAVLSAWSSRSCPDFAEGHAVPTVMGRHGLRFRSITKRHVMVAAGIMVPQVRRAGRRHLAHE